MTILIKAKTALWLMGRGGPEMFLGVNYLTAISFIRLKEVKLFCLVSLCRRNDLVILSEIK